MFQFTDDLKTNIQHIDSQHRELVKMVNHTAALGTSNPSKEEMKKCLDFLGEYVVKHFGDEEALQMASAYPYYDHHKHIHDSFIKSFKALYADFEVTGPTSKLAYALSYTVSDWLISHIGGEDVKFGKYFANVMRYDLYEFRAGRETLLLSSFRTSELPLFLSVHYGIPIEHATETAEQLAEGEDCPPYGYKSRTLSLRLRELA
ncbi:MAG: hemerythrin family protein [Peptococcaceae bacterium]|nr:hemerythrin family protein [Peptococcaceae bacterium]